MQNRIKRHQRIRAGDLVPHELNPRTHPDAQKAVLQALYDEIGFARSLLAYELPDGRLKLIDGHLRQSMTPDEEVTVEVLDLNDAEARKLLSALDPLASLAQNDAAKLDELLKSIETDSPALQQMLDDLKAEQPAALPEPGAGGDEFDTTPEQGPTRTSVGELWLIGGKHRLLVGDCTVAQNVERLMGGENVGLCFTSPPYAQQRDYGEKIQDWFALMCGAFACLPMAEDGQVLVNLGICYREGDWQDYWHEWTNWMGQQGWRKFGWYVWDKISAPPGDWCGRFGPAHEWIFHFNKKSREVNHIIPKKESSIKLKTGSSLRYPDGSLHTANYSPESGLNTHKIPDSVWRFHVAHTAGTVEVAHPAVYPVDLPSHAAQAFTNEGDALYDPFLGSGTTLIAAHRLNRRCYGCEIEPRYADVILKRCEAEGLTCEQIP